MNSPFGQIDGHVAEYLQFRGFHDLAQQFKTAAARPDQFADVQQTTQLLFGLAWTGQIQQLQIVFKQFADTFVAQNPQLQSAGQLVQVELIKFCLSVCIQKKNNIVEIAKSLQKTFPGEFENYSSEKNLRKDESIICYEQDIVQQQIESQLTNLVSFAFSNRKLPALYSVIGQDFEKIAMMSEIMALRNHVEALKKKQT